MGGLTGALNFDGLWIILAGAVLAGFVRGFSGFGTAMIFLPIASTVMTPVHAILTLTIMDLFGPLPLVPRALKDASRRHLGLLTVGVVIFMPLGLMLLQHMEPVTYRTILGAVTLVCVGLMLAGWRFHGALSSPVLLATGSVGGFLGGVAGVPGPPVVLMTMASPMGPAAIRATNLLYLLLTEVVLFSALALLGALSAGPLWIGALAVVPYLIGCQCGAWLFDPDRERIYRAVAYALITFAAISALPFWG